MAGSPRAVIDEYARTSYSSATRSSASSCPPKLVAVHFDGPAGGVVRTGEPMAAYVAIQVNEPIPDWTLTVSFFWPSGYLCTQLISTAKDYARQLHSGIVSFDFVCPALTMQRGLYRVDISVSRGNQVVGDWQSCSLLRVDLGTIVVGDFYLQHECKISLQPVLDSTARAIGKASW